MMADFTLGVLLLCWALFSSSAFAALDSKLTGTWSSKSQKVFTGPGFYDPINEKMKEPTLPGISYSFTDDGYYEEAYYRALANPKDPSCPEAIVQWQHGTYAEASNGSLILTPFAVDGRQLMSSPCSKSQSVYTRYNQTEVFKRYEIQTDGFHNVQRLNLYQFDGSPLMPLYLAYDPPQMLPTQTLNPTSTASPRRKSRRDSIEDDEVLEPLNKNALIQGPGAAYHDRWWWIGVGITTIGGVVLLVS